MRGILLPLAMCWCLFEASAQNKDEVKFLKAKAKDLDSYARMAFDQGYPIEARHIWQEILMIYDTDHASTRTALGFKRANGAWMVNAGFNYPLADNPDKRALQKVEAHWKKTAKKVGGGHRKFAEKFQAAGRTDRSVWHFSRALRFLPDDAGLRAKSGMKSFYGLVGSELESQLYENSKAMQDLVIAELKKTYSVEELASSKQNQFLTKANLPHEGYKTDHYTIWSNWEPAFINEVAQNVERSRAFCERFFKGRPGFRPVDLQIKTLILIKGEDLYRDILQANKDLFRPELLEFLVKHTGMCTIGKGADKAQLSGDASDRTVLDLSIRYPVDEWAGMRSDALNEGVGHAVVAMFLGRIEVFTLDMESKAHTVTSNRPKQVLTPDIESWQDLAIESAFEVRGTPIAKLPLISAADFPADARIRAWSFSDYLLRRDPRLLLELDATRDKKSPQGVQAAFRASTGVSLQQLEKEWRDFWTGATPVLRALRGRRPPFDAASKDAVKWLAAFNKIRRRYKNPQSINQGAVTWNVAWSLLCKQHGKYLAKNRKERGAVLEQTQREGLTGSSKKGEYFAQMALVSTKGSPAKVFDQWVHYPGYRDALLHPRLTQIGLYAESGITVIDAMRGVDSTVVIPMRYYPAHNSSGSPAGMDLAELGPSVAALMQREDLEGQVGYPISLHTWQSGSAANARCQVKARGKLIDGVVQSTGVGFNRRTSAPGMRVFYALEPLPRKTRIEVTWTLGANSKASWQFTTK
jgi:hypothetical protein